MKYSFPLIILLSLLFSNCSDPFPYSEEYKKSNPIPLSIAGKVVGNGKIESQTFVGTFYNKGEFVLTNIYENSALPRQGAIIAANRVN